MKWFLSHWTLSKHGAINPIKRKNRGDKIDHFLIHFFCFNFLFVSIFCFAALRCHLLKNNKNKTALLSLGWLFRCFVSSPRPFSTKMWLHGRTAEIKSWLICYPHCSHSRKLNILKILVIRVIRAAAAAGVEEEQRFNFGRLAEYPQLRLRAKKKLPK